MVVGGRELIDTLWNVNMYTSRTHKIKMCELIDTLWNVNTNKEMRQGINTKN